MIFQFVLRVVRAHLDIGWFQIHGGERRALWRDPMDVFEASDNQALRKQ
jgi:hypothetical protein